MKIESSRVTLHRDDCETSATIILLDVRSSREIVLSVDSEERGANYYLFAIVQSAKQKARQRASFLFDV